MSNAINGNNVFHFIRASSGTLRLEGKYSTNGTGNGKSLGSQGSVMLSPSGNWLYVANAKSGNVSVFKVTRTGLNFMQKVSSHGNTPISIAVFGSYLYVLNAESELTGSIAGYVVEATGKLRDIPDSRKTLSNKKAVQPGQISFNSDGTALIITEKATNQIITYRLNRDGSPRKKQVAPSVGIEPFGFAVGPFGQVYVTEAFNGGSGLSAVSSYHVDDTGHVGVIDSSVANGQTASCWAVVTGDYKYVYVANTGSNTISGYHVNGRGMLTLLGTGISASTGAAPADEALSADSKYLYVLNGGDKAIGEYKVAHDGSLTSIGSIGDLHQKSAGLAAK
jgi:6-phosphogluconolactonase (cycloisomerase 2 family)